MAQDSSRYVYCSDYDFKSPTSPLLRQSNAADLDLGAVPSNRNQPSYINLQKVSSSQSVRERTWRHSQPSASLIGSYEESILKGRMSATPSQPLNFTARISIIRHGDKSNFLTPKIVPLPLVYYSNDTTRGMQDFFDRPSPICRPDTHESLFAHNQLKDSEL